jgi:hypothetical protein
MSNRTITITMSIEYAQTAIDCLDNDMDLSGSGYPNFRDVGEMTFYLRRAELRELLWAAIREANAAEEPTEETEGEDVYWSYSKPKSEGV